MGSQTSGRVSRLLPDFHHSWMFGSVSRPLPDIREGLYQLSDNREGLLNFWEGIPTTPGHPRGQPDHSRISGYVSRPLPDIREDFLLLPDIQEGLLTTLGHSELPFNHSQTSGKTPYHSRTSGRVSRPLQDIR